MKKRNYLLVAPILLGALQSCKKETEKQSTRYANLIVGKWQVYQRNTHVYSIDDNSLLKDTTISFAASSNAAWFETYNSDGAGYVTGKPYTVAGLLKADTTSFLNYSIEGSHLTLKPNGGGTETKPILELSETGMSLESTYSGPARAGWGLNAETTYKFTDEVLYKKQ